jgi:tetratricopeptide (TPR) repeat protein
MSRLRRLLYGLLVTALALVATEVLLRSTGVVDTEQLLSPLLFQRLDDDLHDLPVRDGRVQWHDGNLYEQQPPGFRAITLGGSATAGDGVTPFASFSHRLQRLALRADPSRPAEVINMGRGGAGSRQVAQLLELGLESFRPQVAIVYSGNNEFHELRALKHASPAYGANLERTRRRLHGLHLYRALQHLLGRDRLAPFEPLGNDQPGVHALPTLADAQDRALALTLYAENLRRMARVARDAGVPLVLATVADNRAGWVDAPPGLQLTAEEERLLAELDGLRARRDTAAALALAERAWPALRDERAFYRVGLVLLQLGQTEQARRFLDQAELVMVRPNRASVELRDALRRVARDEGAVLCEVADELDRRSELGVAGNDLFVDACHPSPEGHAQIARLLAACVQQAGALPAADWEQPLEEDPWRLDHHAKRREALPEPAPEDPAMAEAQLGHEAFAARQLDAAAEHYAQALTLGGPPAALRTDQALVRWHQGDMDAFHTLLATVEAADPELVNWKSLLTR